MDLGGVTKHVGMAVQLLVDADAGGQGRPDELQRFGDHRPDFHCLTDTVCLPYDLSTSGSRYRAHLHNDTAAVVHIHRNESLVASLAPGKHQDLKIRHGDTILVKNASNDVTMGACDVHTKGWAKVDITGHILGDRVDWHTDGTPRRAGRR